MKKIIIALLFVCALSISAFATEGEVTDPATEGEISVGDSTENPEVIPDETVTETETEAEPETEIVTETETESTGTSATTINETINNNYIDTGTDILTGMSAYPASTYTSSEATGLKAALLAVLGNYESIIIDYEYTNDTTGDVTNVRDIQPDYVWIASAAVLLLFVFCLFKLGVAIWKR